MDLLNELVAGRVYFDHAPDQVGVPYIVLLQVGGEPVEFLDGPSDMDLIRLQIDIYSETRTSANELMSQARIRLRTLQASAIGAPVSFYESAVGLYRRRCDFRILAPA
ncbi:DUF3168 domain-containing protein [Herbaspirillum huttiense]|uniref:tail completion protein gp17 n=1 Tax=Herbaspirillum huttiense TaxID=863372 RepID=UPI001416F4D3|nr:DUF3168 domain-containing protein [Herbaspirillum huttiense]